MYELDEKTSIIYFGDPLCSWCWGISNELRKLKEKNGEISFQVILGGLRPGTTSLMSDNERLYIREHWEHVTEKSGQPINFDLIDKKIPFVYDTEKPCRAVVSVRTLKPNTEFDFFELVQKNFYVNNQDTNEVSFYEPLTQQVGLSFMEFKKAFESEEMRKATNDDFMWSRQVGVNSYPTTVLQYNKKLYALAIGYSTADKMNEIKDQVMAGNLS